jgi:hypothetical protein
MNGNGVADLERKFRGCGFTFRCFPDAACEVLKFQAGRTVEEIAIVPAHVGTGGRRVELKVEKFHLVACAATEAELTERLEQLPSVAPPYRELLDA